MSRKRLSSGRATIARITKVIIRRYRDNGAVTAYVEWIDSNGDRGRTEGSLQHAGDWTKPHRGGVLRLGGHMRALLERAKREGVPLRRETR